MGLEFMYQNTYNSTIDTLNMRDNVRKILNNATMNKNAAFDTYQPSAIEQTLNNTALYNEAIINTKKLPETLEFLKSDSANKLLKLTQKQAYSQTTELAQVIELQIDESKNNIFAA